MASMGGRYLVPRPRCMPGSAPTAAVSSVPIEDRQLATSAPSTTGLCQVGGWRSPDGRGDVADHEIGSEVDCSRASALDEACFNSGFAVSTSPVGLDPPGAGSRTDRHSLFE